MTNDHRKQTIGLAAAVALALGILSGGASAQQAPTPVADTSYLRDTNGNVPMSNYGLCWHTAYGPVSQTWTKGCDPKQVPAFVALLAEPAPVVLAAAAAAPVAAQRVTFDADTLFDYDRSTLRPAGRDTLDNFVYRIKDVRPEAIMVVGHASRPGTEKYNQTLSEQRADSVKAYLVSLGIASNRVQASGRGETQPVTGPFECLNNLSEKATACRQPDRRVDIELIGARIPQ